MRVSLCLFVIGLFLMTMGYANQAKPICAPALPKESTEASVYTKIMKGTASLRS